MEETKIEPIPLERAKSISAQNIAQELEKNIFIYTENINQQIIEHVSKGWKTLFLFEFFALPNKNPNDLLNEILSEDDEKFPHIIKRDNNDEFDFFTHKIAFAKALHSFEKIGYTIEIVDGSGWTVFPIRTKHFLKKPEYSISIHEKSWAWNAIYCGNECTSKYLESIMEMGHGYKLIRLNSYRVCLSWES